jgi:hypothetical protein
VVYSGFSGLEELCDYIEEAAKRREKIKAVSTKYSEMWTDISGSDGINIRLYVVIYTKTFFYYSLNQIHVTRKKHATICYSHKVDFGYPV